MSPNDEKEMRRLSAMLEAVDGTLPDPSPLREALIKGALAIQLAFARGFRDQIERTYTALQDPHSELTQQQRDELRGLGIDLEL